MRRLSGRRFTNRRRTNSRRSHGGSTAKRRSLKRPIATPIDGRSPAFTPVDAPTRRRSLPAWFASLSVHVTMLVLLATVSLATVEPPPPLEMHFTPAAVEEVQFDEVEVEGVVGDVGVPSSPARRLPRLIDSGAMAFGGFSGEAEIGTGLEEAAPAARPPWARRAAAETLARSAQCLAVAGGRGTGEFRAGLGRGANREVLRRRDRGPAASSSSSTTPAACRGPPRNRDRRAVHATASTASTTIEDFASSSTATRYPMLSTPLTAMCGRPRRTKSGENWLDTVELPRRSSRRRSPTAASIDPDTVFLLSDSRIKARTSFAFCSAMASTGDSHLRRRHERQRRGAEEPAEDRRRQRREFSRLEISPEMRDLSRRQLRPYHNETPGPVWATEIALQVRPLTLVPAPRGERTYRRSAAWVRLSSVTPAPRKTPRSANRSRRP